MGFPMTPHTFGFKSVTIVTENTGLFPVLGGGGGQTIELYLMTGPTDPVIHFKPFKDLNVPGHVRIVTHKTFLNRLVRNVSFVMALEALRNPAVSLGMTSLTPHLLMGALVRLESFGGPLMTGYTLPAHTGKFYPAGTVRFLMTGETLPGRLAMGKAVALITPGHDGLPVIFQGVIAVIDFVTVGADLPVFTPLVLENPVDGIVTASTLHRGKGFNFAFEKSFFRGNFLYPRCFLRKFNLTHGLSRTWRLNLPGRSSGLAGRFSGLGRGGTGNQPDKTRYQKD